MAIQGNPSPWSNPAEGQLWKPSEGGPEYKWSGGQWTDLGGGGTGSIDLSQVPSVSDYITSLESGENDLLNQLLMAMRSRENPLDIYSRLESEAGLPQLRATSTSLSKEIAGIEDYLDMIEPDISARTGQSMVTEAQRRGMVGAAKEPWMQKLTKLGTSLGRVQGGISEAMQGISTKTGLAIQGQQMDIEPYQLAYQTLVDRNARKLTGFTEDRQTQLDVLWDKLNRERYLSDREWELANSLAAEERQYKQSLQQAAASAGAKLTGGESVEELLGLIGNQAAEQIAWERKPSGGTATERAQSAALTSLRSDIGGGATFEDIVRRYGDTLPAYQIREEYNAASRYGPAKESESQVYQWLNPITPYQQAGINQESANDSSNPQYWINMGFDPETAAIIAGI